MISLIICSKFDHLSDSLINNIDQTIGTEYEIVHIDNSLHQYSIFSAYNEGVRRAKGNVLCFMHEDLHFHTDKWGAKVQEYLQDKEIGILGVAGSNLVPRKGDIRMCPYFNGFQMNGLTTLEIPARHTVSLISHIPTSKLTEVAAIDGLWFCIPKSLFTEISFDENTFKGFHLYDVDISMQAVMSGKKVMICDDIIIEHDSPGVFSTEFYANLEIFLKKWEDSLPLQRGINLDAKDLESLSEKAEWLLQKRISKDATLLSIIKKQTSDITDYTPEEKQVIERSIKKYVKYKYWNTDNIPDAFKMMLELQKERRVSFSIRLDIIGKFLYYGVLRK